MLNVVYRSGRLFMTRGWMVGLLLIVLTVGFGTCGFLDEKFDNGKDHSFLDAIYKAASLLAIQTGSLPTSQNWKLEVARWCGMFFFASALLTFVIGLTRASVHRWLVQMLARDHVIVAGLGSTGVRLVETLRASGRTVVVIEANQLHPSVEACRDLGAIVLFGNPADSSELLAANLRRASSVLALFLEERECVRVATTAYRLLQDCQKLPTIPPVGCVLRLTEPGLLDVVRAHRIKTNQTDRIHLEILNAHEITATTMVREAWVNCREGGFCKLLVLGLGHHHRLGEMVVLRAAKDHLIRNPQPDAPKLMIDVFDQDAVKWLASLLSRHPWLTRACAITPHECWARKHGGSNFSNDYDAAFVCIAEEGHATAQAVMLRRDVLTNRQPIMVRMVHSRTGFGELLADAASGWGENIYPVGLDDSLFDADMATQPERELFARTIHLDYRASSRNRNEPSNVPWTVLAEVYRESNRKLAERYQEHLAWTEVERKPKRYRAVFCPERVLTMPSEVTSQFTANEVDALAEREHSLWRTEREQKGWTYGKDRDEEKQTHPLMVDWATLSEPDQERNRDLIRRIPLILALAEYAIVEDNATN